MNYLRAVSAGPGFPAEHFDGCVHSVFGSAVNLCLRDGRLVTLLTTAHDNQPRAARVETPSGFRFDDQLRAGQIAACRAGGLRFSGAALLLDLRGARRWEADLQSTGLRGPALDMALVGAALDELARHPGVRAGIAGAAFEVGSDTPLIRAAREPIMALNEAVCWLDLPSASASAAKLVGLGPGLTPSGDDFLVGFQAGLWATAPDEARRRFAQAFGAEVEWLAGRTNDISRGFLVDAAQGRVSESLIRLIEQLAGCDETGVRWAARRVLDSGSTSGADTLAGLLIALGALSRISLSCRGRRLEQMVIPEGDL